MVVDGELARATYADADPVGTLVIVEPGLGAPGTAFAPKPGQAWTSIAFSRSCSLLSSSAGRLVLILPADGSELEVDVAARVLGEPKPTPIPSDRCLDAPYFPNVSAWPFAPVVSNSPAEPPTAISVRANAPALAVAGETYRFEITITNDGAQIVRYPTCPNYEVWVYGGAEGRLVRERHALSCETTRELAPHVSATFAMEIGIPADWPVTLDGSFAWILESYRAGLKSPLGIARRA